MRVTLITETYPPEVNGVAMTLSRLVHGLLERGVSVQVIRPRQNKEDRSTQEANLDNQVVRGFPLPGYDSLHFGFPSNRLLKKLWKKDRPDIIYIATEGPLGFFARRLADRMNIPTCSGFHTNFQTYMEHYKLGMIGKWALRYLRNFHNKTAATFVPSEDTREQLERAGFRNVKILGRGVDTKLFSPEKRSVDLRNSWGADEDTPVFAYVGRAASEKNIELSIKAFLHIEKSLPDAKFVIVGDGPELPRLKETYPWVHYAGMQTGENLANHYASADVFLFASATETFGNVVTEAMASGLIVQAFDYAAPRRFISDRKNGYLVSYRDEDAYIRESKKLVEDRLKWDSIRSKARTTAEGISWKRVLDGFIQDLESLSK